MKILKALVINAVIDVMIWIVNSIFNGTVSCYKHSESGFAICVNGLTNIHKQWLSNCTLRK